MGQGWSGAVYNGKDLMSISYQLSWSYWETEVSKQATRLNCGSAQQTRDYSRSLCLTKPLLGKAGVAPSQLRSAMQGEISRVKKVGNSRYKGLG